MKQCCLLILISFSGIIFGQDHSCSGFVINDENIFLGKNLDWESGVGLILFNPKNKLKKSIYSDSTNISWTSKYSSITFNHLGLNQPLGGMNEEGLAIEELSTWTVKYPLNNNFILTEFEWIQYQLDNYSTTKEVLDNLDKISISKFYFLLHYLIVDKSGDAAVVEFIDGSPKVYHGRELKYPVLTNNNYSVLVKYENSVSSEHLLELNVNQSQDRFLKILSLLKSGSPGNVKNYQYAMNVLDFVKVPNTKWSIVYDVSSRDIYYKMVFDNTINQISFEQSNLQKNEYKIYRTKE